MAQSEIKQKEAYMLRKKKKKYCKRKERDGEESLGRPFIPQWLKMKMSDCILMQSTHS